MPVHTTSADDLICNLCPPVDMPYHTLLRSLLSDNSVAKSFHLYDSLHLKAITYTQAREHRRAREAADLLLQVHRLGCPAQSCSSWAQQSWTF